MISIKKWGQLKNRKEPSNFNLKNLGRVAQLVKCPTLDFCSDHDLMVLRSSPTLGSELGKELFWDSPSAPPLLMCNLSPCTPTHPPPPQNRGRIEKEPPVSRRKAKDVVYWKPSEYSISRRRRLTNYVKYQWQVKMTTGFINIEIIGDFDKIIERKYA